jgi:hypothetical protein
MHRVEAGRELAFLRGVKPVEPKPFDAASDRQHPLMRWVREQAVHTPQPPRVSQARSREAP